MSGGGVVRGSSGENELPNTLFNLRRWKVLLKLLEIVAVPINIPFPPDAWSVTI